MSIDVTGTLAIRIGHDLPAAQFGERIPVQIRPDALESPGKVQGDDWKRRVRDVLVPVADQHSVDLPEGAYDIAATLPSGETLFAKARVAADETVKVEMKPAEPTPASAERSRLRQRGLRAVIPTAPRISHSPGQAVEVEVHVGRWLHNFGYAGTIAPWSWEAWFSFLEARYDVGADPVPRFQMVGGRQISWNWAGEPFPRLVIRSRAPEFSVQEAGTDRPFLLLASPESARLLSLPWPWDSSGRPPGHPFLEIEVADEKGRLKWTPRLLDRRFGGIIAYLSSGRVDLAQQILKGAHDALFGKYQNPLAAAAGGYVLLSSEESEDLDHWPYWLDNLAEGFAHIPDGPILRARWLLERGDSKDAGRARALLLESVERGIPYFTTGIVWLLAGLRRFAAKDEECAEKLAIVRGVSRVMDLTQAFSSFQFDDPRFAEGRVD